MRPYETAFLIAPNLPDEEIEKIIGQMAEVVSQKKGKMDNIDKWGKKKMAYPIKRFREAYYVIFHYQGEPDIPTELERLFKQAESILRYLTIKKDPRENVRGKKKVRRRYQGSEAPPKKEASPEPVAPPAEEKETEKEES